MKIILILLLLFGFYGLQFSQEDCEIRLVKFETSECHTDINIYKINNRIVSIEKYGDTTVIEISIKANCCISQKPAIKQYSDTLDLIFDYSVPEYIIENGDTVLIVEEECECECCYSFKYFLLGLEDRSYIYRADNSIINKSKHKYKIVQVPKFSIIEGDTLNYIDVYRMKQGLHKFYDKQNREIRSLLYVDDYPVSGLVLRIYSESGKIEREAYWIKRNKFKILLFDLNGIVIKECISDSKFSNCVD